jgi:hypothetical protein
VLSSIIFTGGEVLENLYNLKTEHFMNENNKKIFTSMLDLFDRNMPIDETFIMRSDSSINENEMIEILSITPISNVLAYTNEIIEEYKKRELQSLASRISNMINDGKTSAELIDSMEDVMTSLEIGEDTALQSVGEYAEIAKSLPKLKMMPTGFSLLDKALDKYDRKDASLGGIGEGQFVFLSGRPESGKTYLGTTIMQNLACIKSEEFPNGVKCGFFTLEFGKQAYWENIENRYPHSDNFIKQRLFDNVYFDETAGDVRDVEKFVDRMVKKGCKFIFIDSAMRVNNAKMSNATLGESTGDVFGRIGKKCREHKIAIMIVVQTPKSAHQSKDITVLNSIKADHEASIWFHIFRDDVESEYREMLIFKNKQSFKRTKFEFQLWENPSNKLDKQIKIRNLKSDENNNENHEETIYTADDNYQRDDNGHLSAELPIGFE